MSDTETETKTVGSSSMCYDWQRGVCHRGDKCKFDHPENVERICRDFEKGICNRGVSCKFNHPASETKRDISGLPPCKDFQTKGCSRRTCKFLHITDQEEQHYNETGQLPPHGGDPTLVAQRLGTYGFGYGAPPPREAYGVPMTDFDHEPYCKDFQKGECNRGNSCKYRHVTKRELTLERTLAEMRRGPLPFDAPPMLGKRPRGPGGPGGPIDPYLEVEKLRKRITALQKSNTDLQNTVDRLSIENKKLRQERGDFANSSHA